MLLRRLTTPPPEALGTVGLRNGHLLSEVLVALVLENPLLILDEKFTHFGWDSGKGERGKREKGGTGNRKENGSEQLRCPPRDALDDTGPTRHSRYRRGPRKSRPPPA